MNLFFRGAEEKPDSEDDQGYAAEDDEQFAGVHVSSFPRGNPAGAGHW